MRKFDEYDFEALNRLDRVVRLFRELRYTMPLQYVTSFLAVALDEGRTVTEYADKLKTSKSVMSRHLLDIGPRARDMEPGLDLVEFKPRLTNLREHEYRLTPTGHALACKLIRVLQEEY